jgi:hypothetical protein
VNITRTRVLAGAAAAGGLLLACNAILGIEEATPRVDGDASAPANDVVNEDRANPGVDSGFDTGTDGAVATDASDASLTDAGDAADAGDVSVSDGGVTVTSVMAGTNGACAILSDTTAKCWGRWYWGLGNGVTPFESPIPTTLRWDDQSPITGILQLTEIRGGGMCALRSSDNGGTRINCWGDNQEQQLGILGGPSARAAATRGSVVRHPVTGDVEDATSIADTCALLKDGRVLCWGPSFFGQLGRGQASGAQAVDQVRNIDGGSAPPFRALWTIGSNTRFAAMADGGELVGWGLKGHLVTTGMTARVDCVNDSCGLAYPFLPTNNGGQSLRASIGAVALPRTELNPDGGGVRASIVEAHVVASTVDGGVVRWRSFVDLAKDSLPVAIVSVAQSTDTTCYVDVNGKAYCAGVGRSGKLGRAGSVSGAVQTFAQIDNASNFESLVAGPSFVCGLKTTKEVFCWGDNRNGVLGHDAGAPGSGDLLPDAGCISDHDPNANLPTFCNPVPSRIPLP